MTALDSASQAFCRRQNLDAGRIYFARADKTWGPKRAGAFGCGATVAVAVAVAESLK